MRLVLTLQLCSGVFLAIAGIIIFNHLLQDAWITIGDWKTLGFVSAFVLGAGLVGLVPLGERARRLVARVFLSLACLVVARTLWADRLTTTAFYRQDDYVAVHRDASAISDRLADARFVYGAGGRDWIRLLTDKAFLDAFRIVSVVDGAKGGIPLNLTEAQFAALQENPRLQLWYGGYYFESYVDAGSGGGKDFVLVLPPGEFRNLALIIAADLYAELVQ